MSRYRSRLRAHDALSWAGKTMTVDFDKGERDAAAGRAVVTSAPVLERIVHPVVPAPAHKCYRVIRLFMREGNLTIEDIGNGPTLAGALAISTREKWRAQILAPNGRVASDNWQPMERR